MKRNVKSKLTFVIMQSPFWAWTKAFIQDRLCLAASLFNLQVPWVPKDNIKDGASVFSHFCSSLS